MNIKAEASGFPRRAISLRLRAKRGLEESIAEVLPNNMAMLKMIARSGLDITTKTKVRESSTRLRGL